MVCLNCGKSPLEFTSERKFQEHLNKCGSGIKYDLKIQSGLTRKQNLLTKTIDGDAKK